MSTLGSPTAEVFLAQNPSLNAPAARIGLRQPSWLHPSSSPQGPMAPPRPATKPLLGAWLLLAEAEPPDWRRLHLTGLSHSSSSVGERSDAVVVLAVSAAFPSLKAAKAASSVSSRIASRRWELAFPGKAPASAGGQGRGRMRRLARVVLLCLGCGLCSLLYTFSQLALSLEQEAPWRQGDSAFPARRQLSGDNTRLEAVAGSVGRDERQRRSGSERYDFPRSQLSERMHLAVVACGERLEETVTMLKSAIIFSIRSLQFHIFAEESLQSDFREIVSIHKRMHAWIKVNLYFSTKLKYA
uniref:Uncharacterized protein n=1 Tax=Laticauda laticaudata TaxID=8630 RepID=A0A8C5SHT0_LATLA